MKNDVCIKDDVTIKPPVVVLGMHRSGSSAITEFLTNHGLYFGTDDDSIGSNHENQRGFWERRDVRNLNDEILFKFNCDWHCISGFDLNKLDESETNYFVNKARSLHEEISTKAGMAYVVKEPRMCLTFPIWAAAYNLEPEIVFIHRNPIEIAASLSHRNKLEQDHCLNLWFKYVYSALKSVVGKRVLFISYEQLNNDPLMISEIICDFFKNNDFLNRPSDEAILKIINKKLRHQKDQGNYELPAPHKILNDYINTLCQSHTIKDVIVPIEIDNALNKVIFNSEYERSIIFEQFLKNRNSYNETAEYNIFLKEKVLNLEGLYIHVKEKLNDCSSELSTYRRFSSVKKLRNILLRIAKK
jgi:hypothetical protein